MHRHCAQTQTWAPATLARRAATGKVRWPLRHATVRARPIASRSLIRAHAPIEGEPLMDSESIGEVRSALAAFPGLGDVTVVEHGAGQADQCLIAYVVPSGPGLDVPELHAYARKTLTNGSMPAAIVVVDEIPVTAAETV